MSKVALILIYDNLKDEIPGSANEFQGRRFIKFVDRSSHCDGDSSSPGFTVESLDIIP